MTILTIEPLSFFGPWTVVKSESPKYVRVNNLDRITCAYVVKNHVDDVVFASQKAYVFSLSYPIISWYYHCSDVISDIRYNLISVNF